MGLFNSDKALHKAALRWGEHMRTEHYNDFLGLDAHSQTKPEGRGIEAEAWVGPQRLCDFCVADASGVPIPSRGSTGWMFAEPTAHAFVWFVTGGGERTPNKAELWAMLGELDKTRDRDPRLRMPV